MVMSVDRQGFPGLVAVLQSLWQHALQPERLLVHIVLLDEPQDSLLSYLHCHHLPTDQVRARELLLLPHALYCSPSHRWQLQNSPRNKSAPSGEWWTLLTWLEIFLVLPTLPVSSFLSSFLPCTEHCTWMWTH